MMEPIDVLKWLVAGGAFVATSWFASWGLEELQWWHTLHSKAKSMIILIISALIGVGASLLLERPDTVEALRPVLVPILLTIAAWLATQTAHRGQQWLMNRTGIDLDLIDTIEANVEIMDKNTAALTAFDGE